MKGVRKISKHSKKYLQCFIFLLLFFLTGCNPLNSFDSNSVEAEEHVAASGNGSGYIIDSYDIKQPDKKAKKVVKTYDNLSEFAKVAKKEFLKRFRDRFFDDSRGLIYNIIIALASYLTVISWLVYGILRYGIGRHLLEMIANPTRMQSFRGIDLIKVFTLGIYNLDTEPTLARFFTTSLINVAIIYVVMFVLPH